TPPRSTGPKACGLLDRQTVPRVGVRRHGRTRHSGTSYQSSVILVRCEARMRSRTERGVTAPSVRVSSIGWTAQTLRVLTAAAAYAAAALGAASGFARRAGAMSSVQLPSVAR